MVKVDLSVEAAAEAIRLSSARAMAANAAAPPVDGPLISFARRTAVRRFLGGRVLLLWRLAYEDVTGHRVESALVAVTIELPRARLDVRRADWSNAAVVAVVSRQAATWRDTAKEVVRRFTATRLARERAIAIAGAASTNPVQAGLFDRRAERARFVGATGGANLAEQIAARANTAASAGVISAQSPELLLVLIPRNAARM
jgi:hypothetical protein